MKCPMCKDKMSSERFWDDGWITYFSCLKCKVSITNMYGEYRVGDCKDKDDTNVYSYVDKLNKKKQLKVKGELN